MAVSEKQLDGYREEMKHGTLEAPVPVPDTKIPEEPVLTDEPLTFASAGDWTKKVSNTTFDELDCLNNGKTTINKQLNTYKDNERINNRTERTGA